MHFFKLVSSLPKIIQYYKKAEKKDICKNSEKKYWCIYLVEREKKNLFT